MRSRQTGITFIGWVVLLVPVAIVFFAGIKLFPVYMNHFKVAAALKQTAEANRGEGGLSAAGLRGELGRRFDIESIEVPTPDEILIERQDGDWVMTAEYDRETGLIANIALTVHFYKSVVVQ